MGRGPARRAGALQQWGWVADALFAARDSERALRLDPACEEALLTRAHALLALDQLQARRRSFTSGACITLFKCHLW